MKTSKKYQAALKKYHEESLDIIMESTDVEDAYFKLVEWVGEDHPIIIQSLREYDTIKRENHHRTTKLYKALK